MIAGDHRQLTQRVAKIQRHAGMASKHLRTAADATGDAQDEAWLDALEEMREVLDVVTATRALFGRLSDEANRKYALDQD